MSQIEEIEKAFNNLRKKIEKMSMGYDKSMGDIDSAIEEVASFQRKMEMLVEDVMKLLDDKTRFYAKRCLENLDIIRTKIEDSDQGVLQYLFDGYFQNSYTQFRSIKVPMVAIIEDVRLIHALRIYPIEEKIELKSSLSDLGFVSVVQCLDDAERNLAEKHPSHLKDAVDRSREAIDKFISSALEKEGKKPSNMFNTDIGTFGGLGIISKEEKRIVEATWSFLSEAGPHGRMGELSLGDVNFSLKDTYMIIDLLLKKYRQFKSKKKTQ